MQIHFSCGYQITTWKLCSVSFPEAAVERWLHRRADYLCLCLVTIEMLQRGVGGCRAGSEDRGGGGDEDAMPVHDWRRQREKQHLYEARERGCMEWRSARASLSLSLHSHCLHHHHRRLLLSGLRVNGRHSEQVCIRHLLASSVKWNDCHREGQVSKVRGWCIPVYSRCVMSVVCYSV